MVLVGVHPVLTQVPPNSLRSTIATFIPASLKRPARGAPACPVPTMIASYAFDINRSFLILVPDNSLVFRQIVEAGSPPLLQRSGRLTWPPASRIPHLWRCCALSLWIYSATGVEPTEDNATT